jgi:3D (Asp-Asp-Asp) domain-containing protein
MLTNDQKWGIIAIAVIVAFVVIIFAAAYKADKMIEARKREAEQKLLALKRSALELKAKDNKIKALTQENLRLRTKLLKKAKLPSRSLAVPVQLRGGSRFISTAYTHTGNNTASGIYPKASHTIAVDRRLIPLGAKVRLRCPSMPEYDGIYTAEDTGGDIKGKRIDIFTDTRGEAINFGRRTVFVEVIK